MFHCSVGNSVDHGTPYHTTSRPTTTTTTTTGDTTTTQSKVRYGTWNLQGLADRYGEDIGHIDNHNLEVLFVQEYCLQYDQLFELKHRCDARRRHLTELRGMTTTNGSRQYGGLLAISKKLFVPLRATTMLKGHKYMPQFVQLQCEDRYLIFANVHNSTKTFTMPSPFMMM